MRFLTWCNKIDERSELLFASAKHFGIDVEPIGLGKEYRGGVSKIEWLADALKDCDDLEPYILCVDAFDSIFVRPPDGIEEAFDSFDTHCVYSGEKWYRKRPAEIQGYFDEKCSQEMWEDGYPCCDVYRYPNAGSVMGWGDYLGRQYANMNAVAKGSLETREQWHVTSYCHESTIEIDYECRLFWCTAGQWRAARKLAHIENGRLTNLKTGGQPFVLHAPIPRRSKTLREDIARRLGII